MHFYGKKISLKTNEPNLKGYALKTITEVYLIFKINTYLVQNIHFD